ncbi:hypothetical protein KIN20_003747 [Parelaphostrongylus tenuis]|uniref:Uncharacterized protein n=1 Tax=Parelaphostrongylus tenuis TaxID=148309 RepID=A0AAD5QEM9_PARTN|nr:hypothetical protein KIN20_003747 [Parelaphostrongylus tenuis]
MASSRGKDRPKEHQNAARHFVFGSSTPRDLSHMNKIPPKFRSYDAKVRVHREGPQLREYMEKARSLTRNVEEFMYDSIDGVVNVYDLCVVASFHIICTPPLYHSFEIAMNFLLLASSDVMHKGPSSLEYYDNRHTPTTQDDCHECALHFSENRKGHCFGWPPMQITTTQLLRKWIIS